MRTLEWHVKLLLIILCFAANSYAQPAPQVFYHWVTKDKVYCWRSLADPKPVVATAAQGGWTITPESVKADPQWLSVLKSKVPADTPPSKIWNAFLKKLREEHPDNQLATIRVPDAQLYLRYMSPNSVLVTYIKNQKADTANFIKDAQGWRLDNKDSLGKLPITAAEMKAVFGSEQAISSPETVSAAWGKWIAGFLENQSNINPVMYQEAEGISGWIWQERLLENDWNRRLSLPRISEQQEPVESSSQEGVNNQTTQNQKSGQTPFYKEWWFFVIVPLAVTLILVFWQSPKVRNGLSRAWRSLPLLNKFRRKEESGQEKITEPTSLDEVAPAQEASQIGHLEGVYSEYVAAANKSVCEFLGKVRAHVEGQRANLLQEYGLTDLSPQSAKDLIELGKEVETCHDALIQAQKVETNSSGCTLYPGERTKTQWLADLKQSIPSVVSDIEEQKGALRELGTIRDERDTLKKELNSTRDRLKKSQQRSADARATVRKKTTQISTELETERKKYTGLQEVINGISNSVTSYDEYMHQGLRYYLDETQDTPSAAVISSLTNHSLYKLCIAMISQDDVLRDAMLVNLYSIASKLSRLNGFKLAVEEMRKRFPDIEDRQKQLSRSDKSHFNDTLFQKLLLHIRTSSQLELAPFYFDVGEDKHVHYAG